MIPLRPLFGALGRMVVLYVVLLALWPVVGGAYSAAFRAVGEAVFGSFGSDGVVKFRGADASVSGGVHENKMHLWNRRNPNAVFPMTNSTRYVGYLPTILVVVLIVATPVSWGRRGWALLGGMAIVHCFIAIRLGVVLLGAFCGDAPWRIWQPSAFWQSVLTTTGEGLSNSPPISFIVPVLIWLMVTVRRDDVARALREMGTRSPTGRG